jgi:hypothetical protein
MTMENSPEKQEPAYRSHTGWNENRPHVLVIACSDGRLQENLDDFLQVQLGISRYDRVYTPGGPGALTSHGIEHSRADQFRKECTFLVQAHAIEEVVLIFHGPASDGPEVACCADYRRVFPRATMEEIREQQQRDVFAILDYGFGVPQSNLRVSVYRCEATADNAIQFVHMQPR